jgi:hypothetical protein
MMQLFRTFQVLRPGMIVILFFSVILSYGQTLNQTYTSAGTHTFTVPPGVTQVIVECWGGGGGGGFARNNNGAAGGGGGGGGYSISTVSVAPGTNITVTVGAGGAGGTTGGTQAIAGGASSFGALLSAGGGSRGQGVSSNTSGAGGAGGTGDTYNGGAGANGVSGTGLSAGGGGGGSSAGTASDGNNGSGLNGGVAVTDGGAGGSGARGAQGGSGTPPGGGGAGGHRIPGTNRAGGSGADGQVRVWIPPFVYFSEGSLSPHLYSSWKTPLGTNPVNFTSNDQVFVIQNGHNMTTTAAWSVSGANTTVQIQNGGILTENNNITLSASTSLQIDDGGTLNHNVNSISIFGGTESFDAASTVNYGRSGVQAVQGLNYGNLTTSGSGTKTLNNNTRVNGTLTLNSSVLSLGSYDLTLGPAAVISGSFSATSMINIGGSSIIKEGNQNADFILTFPIGIGTDYTPVEISGFTATTIAPSSSVAIQSSATAAPGTPGFYPLRRHWITSTNGFSGSLLANISFAYLSADIPAGGSVDRYEIVYRPATGTWGKPGGAAPSGSNPMYAAAATTLDATWTASIPEKRIFYSYKSGSWDDAGTWTLDPSGMQWLNPDTYSPSTSPTSANDEVVVLSGKTVSVTSNNKVNRSLTVTGTLDLGTTTGHSFSTISGSGLIRLAGDNFPAGVATGFTSPGQGEGTVEFYGNSRNLSNSRTFYNVNVNMTAGNTLTLLTDYVINGNLTLASGIFSINNTTAVARNITVYGNITVESSGRISTGTGNARHQLNLYGDFTNNGEASFTNRTSAVYGSEAANGIVDVNFLSPDRNQSILCRGITSFYRIEIDKGTDFTYILNIDATDTDYFRLYGFANEGHGAASQLTENNNALGLIRGTVRIGNNIDIPVLSQNAGNYNISEAAQLWIDNGTVSKNSGTALVVYGKTRITGGTLNALIAGGITFRENGIISIEGGIVNASQIKTAAEGSGTNGGYVQTGGAVNVTGGTTDTDYYVFTLPYSSSVFNMSGGTLKVNTSTANGGILIGSAPENYKVTGGSVIAETQSTQDFRITSTAPFWNFELRNSSAAARQFILSEAQNIGPANINIAAQPLKVLNDLRIWGKESGGDSYPAIAFITGINDVYIGGSFFIESGSQYIPVSGGTPPYDAIANQPSLRNTTYFVRTAGTSPVEELYHGDPVNQLEFGTLSIDRTNGYELRLTSPPGRINESVIMDVNGNTSVLSGTLNQNLFTIRTWGAIVNNDRMGTWYPGTTPSRAQIQFVENPSLTLSTGPNAVFGNVQVNVTPPSVLTLTSDVYFERMEYVKGLVYLKSYNLKVDNLWNLEQGLFQDVPATSFLRVMNNGYSGSSMIYTDGKASDGGLSLRINANSQSENENNILNNFGPVTYPIGFTSNGGTTVYFRPAQMVVRNLSSPGYITIRPVMGALPTTNQAGGEILQHYWRVSHNGFTVLPSVSYRFYYRRQTGVTGVDLSTLTNETNYVPGKVLDELPYTRQAENTNDIVRSLIETNSRAITVNGTSTGGLFSPSSAGITLENANYTAGVSNRFTGSVLIYYTRDYEQEARWNNAQAWTRSDILNTAYEPHDSRQPAAPAYPGAGDVAVIGWIPWTDANRSASLRGQPHGVWISGYSQQAAEVVFTKMTDASGNPVPRSYRSNFQFRPTLCIDQSSGQLVTKLVKGEGLFWNRASDPNYTQMDIGDFARQDSSYVIYENFTNNRIIYNTPDLLPNLYISNDNWGANNLNFTFAKNINTTGNIELLGNVNLLLPTGATGDITVGGNLIMFVSQNSGSGAEIGYGNSGTARKIVVKGDLIMNNAGSVINVRDPGAGTVVDHELHIQGDIIQGSASYSSTGLRLWTASNRARITLFLDGNNSMTYNLINGTVPQLYRLVINKGISQATTARFNLDFVLNGPSSGAGIPKALELQNGTFIYNNPNSSRLLVLTSGNDYFTIPSTAGLEILQGTARAGGSSGISLDGTLTISGGSFDMSGGDNPIEYSSSGNATINVTAGTLTVGGQVRRSPTSDVGILNYNQSGGTVIVGNDAATVNNRGVFEILNTGSSFTMSGGDFYIARSQSNPAVAAFYFDPATFNIAAEANIHIGHLVTPASQTIGIFAGKPLPRLRVNNSSNRNPVARLETVPATITSLLQIDAGSTFDANGQDLTLNGDMNAFGAYVPGGNITYFGSSGTQTINGGGTSVTFHDLDKTASGNLVLNGGNTPVTIGNALFLRAGSFTDNGNTVIIKGNVLNDATHVNSSPGDGMVMNGDNPQQLTGNGIFGKLTIRNPKGVFIPVGSQFTITRSLRMEAGVLNIGRNLLVIGVNAVIEEASPFSPLNMIETNISFTDNGLRKNFPSGGPQEFTFPLGSNDKYTPVRLNITANGTSSGSITVKPANERHPGIIEDTETGAQIADKDNALQYYWIMKSEGISGFSAIGRMYYADQDVKVASPYTIADYHPAVLLNDGAGNWLKFPGTDFDETNKCLIFRFTGTNDAGISGDYTAGAGDNSLNGAIPDMVVRYETVSSGNWTTGTIWNPIIAGGPRGAIARINSTHTVDVTGNDLSLYMTEIFGTLNLYSTYGHRLGIVNGTGTVYLERGEIPAAVYDGFFSQGGGTLEFGGTTSYDILGNITAVNNLRLTGTGERRLPNNSLTVNGDLTISGGAGLSVTNSNNRRISIKGNMTRISGSFESGSGANATLVFDGVTTQVITGSFTGSNALNNLEINNASNVIFLDDTEVKRELKLLNGLVNVASGSVFRIKYGAVVSPSSGSVQSFVNGTVTKEMMAGNSFTFPVGSYTTVGAHGPVTLKGVSGLAGISDWEATYFFASPSLAGYNTSNVNSPVSTVSNTEYWKIEAPAGGSSVISITLDGSSDVALSVTDLTNLRIVGWNQSDNRWEVAGSGAIITGTASSGTISTTANVDYDDYSYFTLASVMPVATGSATITTPATVDLCNGTSTTISVSFTGQMPYVLTYTAGATTITTPAINASSYNITITPASTTIYSLVGVTANGVPGFLTGTTAVTVNVSPIPTVTLSRSGSGAICEGSSITFTATAGLANYNFRVNGTTVQNGPGNTLITTTLLTGIQSVDVIGTNAGGCSATSSAISLTVNPLPAAAGSITGPVSVCRGSVHSFSIPAIANATGYTWSATNGASVSGSGTTVSVTFPNSGNSIVSVRGNNGCGSGSSSTLSVAVSTASTPGNAGIISGPGQVCRGGSGYVYTVNPIANATSYIWNYSGSGAIITGTGNTVTIDFTQSATGGNLTVAGTNGCATGAYSSNYAIVTNPSPAASIIPANPSICSGVDLTINATATGGTSPYTHSWTGTGAGYLSSGTAPSPLFNSPDGGIYDLTYTVTDNRGCTGTANATVTVFQAPVANAGPDLLNLCSGTTQIVMTGATASGSYSGTPVWSGTGGTWTQNPDPALAAFTPSAPSGSTIVTLTLTGANGCVNTIDTREISWNSAPMQPGGFTQSSAGVCRGQTGVAYSVPADPRAITYIWTYSGTGASINGSGNSITVDFSPTATSGNLSVTASNACGTGIPRTMAVTVIPIPVATFIYPSTPYCPNAPDPSPVFTGGGIAGTFSSSSGLVFVSTSTGVIDLSASTPGDYTVTNTIAAAGGCGVVSATTTISIIRDYTWIGAVNTDWNLPGNWSCGIVPAAGNSVIIPDVPNRPMLSSGAAGSVNDLIIEQGSVLTVAGNALRISGSLTGSGTFDATAGTAEFSGSALQAIPANLFSGNRVMNLTVSNNAGVTLGGPLNVTGTVLVQNGNLASAGHLTLVSDATGTALIDGSGAGTVSGNVTMQRYLPSRFGYRYFSSPFTSSLVSEFGDDMDLASSWPMFYRYDESRTSSGWVPYSTGTSPLVPFEGYAVNFGSVAAPHTVDVTGEVNNGSVSVTLFNNNNTYTKGFNLAGNPYPSPVDWNAAGWTKTGIDNALYFFRTSTTDEYGGTYSSYVNGISSDGVADNIIPSMQGFFVHVSDGTYPVTGVLGATNSVRVNNRSHIFFKSSASANRFLIRLSAAFTDDAASADPMVVYFDDDAAVAFDRELDALKLFNTDMMVTNLFSVLSDGSKLSVNALPPQTDSIVYVPLGLTSYRDGEVVFALRNLENLPENVRIMFRDAATGANTDLVSSGPYRADLKAGDYTNRFALAILKNTTAC